MAKQPRHIDIRFAVAFVLSATSGSSLVGAMPPDNFAMGAFYGLAIFLLFLPGTRFVYGAVCGLAVCGAAISFLLFEPMHGRYAFQGEPNWIIAGYSLFALLLIVVGGVTAELKVIRFRHVVLLSALAVCMESLLMVILPVHLALSQFRQPAALAIASVGGIWLVSFILWISNFLLVKLASTPKNTWLPSLIWFSCVVITWAYLSLPRSTPGTTKVAVLQTTQADLGSMSTLTKRAAAESADLVVWPELSSLSIASLGNTAKLRELSAEPGIPAFVTTFEDAAKPKPHNVAALFYRGSESTRYFKRKPFAGEATLHAAGDKAVVAGWKVPVGLNICFDSCYPAVLRDTVLSGDVAVIALPTEDPPSQNGVIQALHSAYTPFRAAELGVPIARADITAYSMIVDSDGWILKELPPGEGIAVATVGKPHDTLYRHFGDWFLYLCYAVTLAWIGKRFRDRWLARKHRAAEVD